MNKKGSLQAFRGIDFDPRKGVFADADRVLAAAKDANSLADILRSLGLRSPGVRYAQLRAAMVKHGIRQPTKNRLDVRPSVFADRGAVARAVRQSKTQKEALERLGVSLAGKNYDRLTAVCAVYRIPLPAKRGTRRHAEQERLKRKEGTRFRRWQVLADAEAVKQAVYDASSWSVAAQRLWGQNDASDRAALRARCSELDLGPGEKRTWRILADRDAVEAAVSSANSVIEALTRLNLPSGCHRRLVRACEEYGLSVPRASKGDGARVAQARAKDAYRWGRPEDVLKLNPAISQRRVRNMALRYDLIPYVCAICGSLPIWRGEPLVLILDHENGNPIDHRLENLRFVCPNCESQLPTHGARNVRRHAV